MFLKTMKRLGWWEDSPLEDGSPRLMPGLSSVDLLEEPSVGPSTLKAQVGVRARRRERAPPCWRRPVTVGDRGVPNTIVGVPHPERVRGATEGRNLRPEGT